MVLHCDTNKIKDLPMNKKVKVFWLLFGGVLFVWGVVGFALYRGLQFAMKYFQVD